jgi:hypothetical protein
MGAHYRRTRKTRCLARIRNIIKATELHYHEDLGAWPYDYDRQRATVSQLLDHGEEIGYVKLLRLNTRFSSLPRTWPEKKKFRFA